MSKFRYLFILILALVIVFSACNTIDGIGSTTKPRLSLFIGVDISGSYINSPYFDDSIDFAAHYIFAHLNGLGNLEVPNVLFVSSIGGANANEPKTFYPIQTFENKSISEISKKLHEIFPRNVINPFTDYNAFFEQVALMVKNKNLVLRPISIVMISDGIPDVKKEGNTDFNSIVLKPLEQLARSVTVRLLYTNAVVGKDWLTKVKRRRIKMWTQDAEVMVSWKDPKILLTEKQIEEQAYFFDWLKDNVYFGVRARTIN